MSTTSVVKGISASDSVSIGSNITTGNITIGNGLTTGEVIIRGVENGTWTPVMGDGTNNFTLSVATGHYTRIGNMVQCWCKVVWTSTGTVTGDVQITGLPITVGSDTSFSLNAMRGAGYNSPFMTSGKCVSGTTRIDFYLSFVNSGVGPYFRITQNNPNNNLEGTGEFEFQFAYRV